MSSQELMEAMAEDLVKKIPSGQANAVTRAELARLTQLPDRQLRELLEIARDKGHLICNDQDGRGYYLAETIDEIESQYRRDHTRALSILKRLKPFRRALSQAGRIRPKREAASCG